MFHQLKSNESGLGLDLRGGFKAIPNDQRPQINTWFLYFLVHVTHHFLNHNFSFNFLIKSTLKYINVGKIAVHNPKL